MNTERSEVYYHMCSEGGTSEPLEISPQNFLGNILWLNGRKCSKMAMQRCAGIDLMSMMF